MPRGHTITHTESHTLIHSHLHVHTFCLSHTHTHTHTHTHMHAPSLTGPFAQIAQQIALNASCVSSQGITGESQRSPCPQAMFPPTLNNIPRHPYPHPYAGSSPLVPAPPQISTPLPGSKASSPVSWGDSSWVGDGAASWVETVAETPMQASSRSPDGNPAAPYSTPPASLNQPLWREGSPGGPGEGSSKKLWPVSVWLHLQGLPWEGALGLVSMGAVGGIQWF